MTARTTPDGPADERMPLIEQVRTLERELDEAINALEASALEELRAAGDEMREWTRGAHLQYLLTAPFVYGMAIPLALLDVCITLYQHVCFRVYGIPRVARAEYFVLDRHRLPYLNFFEKAHCVYCAYVNGLLAYAREIGSRTEQFWYPIEHAHRARETHARARRFVVHGDANDPEARQTELRSALSREDASPEATSHSHVQRSEA